MTDSLAAKRADEILDYLIDWTDALGTDTIVAGSSSVSVVGVTLDTAEYFATNVKLWLSGGVAGQTATVTAVITTTAGRRFSRELTLPILPAAAVVLTEAEQLRQYRTEALSARHAIATGGMVVEVWRAGRRTIYSKANMGELNAYIDRLEREIGEAEARAEGRPRRGAITFGYRGRI